MLRRSRVNLRRSVERPERWRTLAQASWLPAPRRDAVPASRLTEAKVTPLPVASPIGGGHSIMVTASPSKGNLARREQIAGPPPCMYAEGGMQVLCHIPAGKYSVLYGESAPPYLLALYQASFPCHCEASDDRVGGADGRIHTEQCRGENAREPSAKGGENGL